MGRSIWILLAAGLVAGLAAGACGKSAAAPDALPTALGGDRPVRLQVPPNIEPGKRYPLVLILHGYSANGYVQQAVLRLKDLPTTHDAFVLAPDGTADSKGNQFWNADPACCNFDGSTVDDVAYLGGLLDTVIAERPIDPARVFVIGHSNGAFMAYRMACERSDVITAIAGLAGAAPSTPSSCPTGRPVALLHLHGTADDTIPYAGAQQNGVTMPGAVASVAEWAAHDGCTGALAPAGAPLDLVTSLDGPETQPSSTAGCPAGGAADLWTIEGGGHLPDFAPAFPEALWSWLDAHARP